MTDSTEKEVKVVEEPQATQLAAEAAAEVTYETAKQDYAKALAIADATAKQTKADAMVTLAAANKVYQDALQAAKDAATPPPDAAEPAADGASADKADAK